MSRWSASIQGINGPAVTGHQGPVLEVAVYDLRLV